MKSLIKNIFFYNPSKGSSAGDVALKSETVHDSFLKDVVVNTTPLLSSLINSSHLLLDPISSYPGFNPSIIKIASGFIVSTRESNFVLKGDNLTFNLNERRNTFCGIYYLDNEFNILKSVMLDDTMIRRDSKYGSEGIEDIRLFEWNNSIWGIGTGIHRSEFQQVTTRQLLIEIIDEKIVSFYELESPSNANIEKNWIPLVIEYDLFIFYSIAPVCVYKFIDGGLIQHKGYVNCNSMLSLRGGTPFVNYNGYYICVAHLERFTLREKQYTRHVFVSLDSSLDVKSVSEPFFIKRKGIEFANGLIINDEKIYLTYGVSDNYSVISIFDLKFVIDSLKIEITSDVSFIK